MNHLYVFGLIQLWLYSHVWQLEVASAFRVQRWAFLCAFVAVAPAVAAAKPDAGEAGSFAAEEPSL